MDGSGSLLQCVPRRSLGTSRLLRLGTHCNAGSCRRVWATVTCSERRWTGGGSLLQCVPRRSLGTSRLLRLGTHCNAGSCPPCLGNGDVFSTQMDGRREPPFSAFPGGAWERVGCSAWERTARGSCPPCLGNGDVFSAQMDGRREPPFSAFPGGAWERVGCSAWERTVLRAPARVFGQRWTCSQRRWTGGGSLLQCVPRRSLGTSTLVVVAFDLFFIALFFSSQSASSSASSCTSSFFNWVEVAAAVAWVRGASSSLSQPSSRRMRLRRGSLVGLLWVRRRRHRRLSWLPTAP